MLVRKNTGILLVRLRTVCKAVQERRPRPFTREPNVIRKSISSRAILVEGSDTITTCEHSPGACELWRGSSARTRMAATWRMLNFCCTDQRSPQELLCSAAPEFAFRLPPRAASNTSRDEQERESNSEHAPDLEAI
jgi:hypothetical protein